MTALLGVMVVANADKARVPTEQEQPAGPVSWFGAALLVLAASGNQLSRELWTKGPHLAYADVLLAGVFGLWALWALLTGRLRRVKWPPLPAWGFLLVAILSLAVAASLKSALAELLQTVLYLGCAYMLFVNTITTESRVRLAVKVLGAMTAVLGLLAVVQYVTHGFSDAIRVRATFDNRNVYSLYVIMALPVLAAVGFERLRTPQRPYWLVWLVAAGSAVLLLTCTAGALFLIAVLVFLYVAWRRAQAARADGVFIGDEVVIWQRALTGLCLAAVLTIVLPIPTRAGVADLFTLNERGRLRIATGDEKEPENVTGVPQVTEVRKRWMEWAAALNLLSGRTTDSETQASFENFFLGVGIGNYQKQINSYYLSLPNLKKIEPDTSNLYLVTGASVGLAGLVCLIWFFLHFWRQARAQYETAGSHYLRALGLGLSGSVLGVMIANLFANCLVRGLGTILMFLLALVTVIPTLRASGESGFGDQHTRPCEDEEADSGRLSESEATEEEQQ